MSKYCDVCNLVCHIHDKINMLSRVLNMKTLTFFYHNMLITMIDKDCLVWIEQEGILHCWIWLILGLKNTIVIVDEEGDEKTNSRYCGRPVGSCPELMPLDNSLFPDIRTSADLHISLTCMLPCIDPHRFNKATPKEITCMIDRIWNPVEGVAQPSNRIIQDIQRLKENMKLVIDASEAVVPGVCGRNKHRNITGTGRRDHPRHEDQSALSIGELLLHKDCREVVVEMELTERACFEQARGSSSNNNLSLMSHGHHRENYFKIK